MLFDRTGILLSRNTGLSDQSASDRQAALSGQLAVSLERRCPQEDVAAAEAALGAGKDEAEGDGEVEQAGGQVTGAPAGTLST
jgi:hypothetical protein